MPSPIIRRLLNGPAALTPPTANMRLWLKADSLRLNNNDPVPTLTDFSGLGRDFTASGTNRPTFLASQIAGKPVVSFDGVDDVMTGTMDTGVTAYSFFIVLKMKSLSGTPVIFQHGDGNNGYLELMVSSQRTLQHRSAGTAISMSDSVANITSYELWSALSTAAPTSVFRLNGVDQTLTPSSAAFGNPPATGFLGRFSSGILPAQFNFAELLVYNTALSNPLRDQTERYLRTKWGLP